MEFHWKAWELAASLAHPPSHQSFSVVDCSSVSSSSRRSVKSFDTTTFFPPFSSQGIHVRKEVFLYESQIPGHEVTPAFTGRRWGGATIHTYLDAVLQLKLAAVQNDREGGHMEELVR